MLLNKYVNNISFLSICLHHTISHVLCVLLLTSAGVQAHGFTLYGGFNCVKAIWPNFCFCFSLVSFTVWQCFYLKRYTLAWFCASNSVKGFGLYVTVQINKLSIISHAFAQKLPTWIYTKPDIEVCFGDVINGDNFLQSVHTFQFCSSQNFRRVTGPKVI